MDYEVLCGEWGGNKASRLGGGNRAANNTHTGLKTAPEAAAGCAAACRRLFFVRPRESLISLPACCWDGVVHLPKAAVLDQCCRDEDGGCGLGRGVSFRGDSRWLGLAKAAGQDMLAGLTQSGQMYVAEFST
jgi:hypothetical protein